VAIRKFPYRELIGSALQVSRWTRCDVSFAVSTLARFNNNPTIKAIKALRHLWKYLYTTSKKKLVYELSPDHQINGRMFTYTDSDWAGDRISRRSTSGWMTFLGRCLINWDANLQSYVAQSSAEAELAGFNKGGNESVFLQNFFIESDLMPEAQHATESFVDNQACISITQNPVLHKRTKHIEIPLFRCRELAAEGRIIPVNLPSELNPSDILTKNVTRKLLETHCYNIGLID
jgi:hypothetical protein